jgi:hypothetical protein
MGIVGSVCTIFERKWTVVPRLGSPASVLWRSALYVELLGSEYLFYNSEV